MDSSIATFRPRSFRLVSPVTIPAFTGVRLRPRPHRPVPLSSAWRRQRSWAPHPCGPCLPGPVWP